MSEPTETRDVTADQAIETSQDHAAEIDFDLSGLEPIATMGDRNWVVDFVSEDPNVLGGGLRVVVDGDSGEVVEHKFLQ